LDEESGKRANEQIVKTDFLSVNPSLRFNERSDGSQRYLGIEIKDNHEAK